jgi:hypothetical protein
LLALEKCEFLLLEHLLDRAEPVRTFGMARRGAVKLAAARAPRWFGGHQGFSRAR